MTTRSPRWIPPRTPACGRLSGSSTAGATLVIIAQRVSSITDADQILVLDGGRLVGHGTHAELLETSETYQEIVNSQLAAEETV